MRNWLIGLYIAEYEQGGTDRAQYGDRLIERLSDRLVHAGVSRAESRELRRYRQFYLTYPQIRESLTPELRRRLLPQTNSSDNRELLTPKWGVAAGDVATKLSFTHIAQLLQCDDAAQRAFYERECIRGNWSVRELKRQIASLYYERSRLSMDKAKLAIQVLQGLGSSEALTESRDRGLVDFAPRSRTLTLVLDRRTSLEWLAPALAARIVCSPLQRDVLLGGLEARISCTIASAP